MTEQSLATTKDKGAIMEQVAIGGDLAALTPAQRVSHYLGVCDSLRLNPLTKPFQYIKLNNKLTLYATRDCTDQLRNRDAISIIITDKQLMGDIYVVGARATNAAGRQDESTGAVPVKGLVGETLANAMMKAETKAKRRVTLSICGLGMVDESEVGSIPDAAPVRVDTTTGEVLEAEAVSASNGKLGLARQALRTAVKEVLRTPEDLEVVTLAVLGRAIPANNLGVGQIDKVTAAINSLRGESADLTSEKIYDLLAPQEAEVVEAEPVDDDGAADMKADILADVQAKLAAKFKTQIMAAAFVSSVVGNKTPLPEQSVDSLIQLQDRLKEHEQDEGPHPATEAA